MEDIFILQEGSNSQPKSIAGFPSVKCAQQGDMQMIVTDYTDRCVVYASELGKVGMMVECCRDSSNAFSIETILGDRDDLWARVLARQVAERMPNKKVPLLLMLGLHNKGLDEDAIKTKLHSILDLFQGLVSDEYSNQKQPPVPSLP